MFYQVSSAFNTTRRFLINHLIEPVNRIDQFRIRSVIFYYKIGMLFFLFIGHLRTDKRPGVSLGHMIPCRESLYLKVALGRHQQNKIKQAPHVELEKQGDFNKNHRRAVFSGLADPPVHQRNYFRMNHCLQFTTQCAILYNDTPQCRTVEGTVIGQDMIPETIRNLYECR